MIRKLLVIAIAFFSVSSFACINALPTDDVNFCATFKTAAGCYCSESLPGCSRFSMDRIYSLLITRYRTLEAACNSQTNTDPQTCIDGWNCYRLGGIDSQGRVCSSTQLACQ
ncbi:MAG: hypothetical protein A3F46_07935 [Legionellales bacterium RIFCSPHIGHO2_12_FULL_42_9]|nr:MAG: hypothetical protein A3F46_07935 [Legionellales bacterium RIFCSPHIGHO2_12_FULL_42_9]